MCTSIGGGAGGGSPKTAKTKEQIKSNAITTLQNMGATKWEKYGKSRLYLNDSGIEIMGMEVERYKSGNVSHATKDGERMSNSEASKAVSAVTSGYIDLNTNQYVPSVYATGKFNDEFRKKLKKYYPDLED